MRPGLSPGKSSASKFEASPSPSKVGKRSSIARRQEEPAQDIEELAGGIDIQLQASASDLRRRRAAQAPGIDPEAGADAQ